MQQVDSNSFKRLLISNILLPLIIGLVTCVVFVVMINALIKQGQDVAKSAQIISMANESQKAVVDGETGLRGYVITGKADFLEPYINARNTAPERLEKLRMLVEGNPRQVARAETLVKQFESWIVYAEKVRGLKASGRDAFATVSQGEGKMIMDRARQNFDLIIRNEELEREEQSNAMAWLTDIVLFLTIVLSLIGSAAIALFGRKQMLGLSTSYQTILDASNERNFILQQQQWLKQGQSELSDKMAVATSIKSLSESISSHFANYLNAQVGALFISVNDTSLERQATFAFTATDEQSDVIKVGEGLLGQVAAEKKPLQLSQLPANFLKISSSLGNMNASNVLIMPFFSDDALLGVLELGFADIIQPKYLEYYEQVADSVATAIRGMQLREQRERLMREIQNQAEELQTQQEELRVTNEELSEQARMLKDAQTRLEGQHAEMEQTNAQLEEQAQVLENQKDLLDRRNEVLVDTKLALEQKATELQRASQYKSEFLANMSHELRTPLNSSLILAKLLADNKDSNLTGQQIEFAKQIQSSGNDLLHLINDILDLAKVESGKLDINAENVSIDGLFNSLRKSFDPLANEKSLKLSFVIEPKTPKTIFTDQQRIEQVLKNLISNSIKFTAKGSVTILAKLDKKLQFRFEVSDTGIGIAQEQQQIIFEAFRQADGTTNRKFGGTGLGLSISKDLARLLGGSIQVSSMVGTGSTFTLTLPQQYLPIDESITDVNLPVEQPVFKLPIVEKSEKVEPQKDAASEILSSGFFEDDRSSIKAGENRVILVVEDDHKFASILFTLANEQKYKCLVTDSATEAIELAKKYQPSAVLLDMKLSDHSGLYVLDQLKQNSKTRHIPVHVISAGDFSRQAMHLGAIGYMLKPVKRDQLVDAFKRIEEKMRQSIRKVLIVEDNEIQRGAIQKLIEDRFLETVAVENGIMALKILEEQSFDCMIMDLNLPGISGFDLLEKMNETANQTYPPIIVYTGRSLSKEEEDKLNRYSRSVIIKGAKSPERLMDEVMLFLHKVESSMDISQKDMLENVRNREKVFENKTIMIVDDDMRNTFALTAALEQKGAKIVIAKNGEESLRKLDSDRSIDIVLMDIMMPIMDGYEAIRRIRKDVVFKKLPIIALTAKATKDDKLLCLQAGANDYLSKPVDLDKLLSLIRIWLSAGWK